MTPRLAATRMLMGIGITDLTYRTSQVAVPLVVLHGTGSAAATGLVGGAAGVPVLLSPWWARGLRHRITSGRAVAVCYLGEAFSLALVALAATTGHLDARILAAAGLALGAAEALDGPGRDALLADLGDRLGSDRALVLLMTRDFFRRLSMVVGPIVGGLLVARGQAVSLIWVEVSAILVSAVLTAGVGRADTGIRADTDAGIWQTVRSHRDVVAGWVVRGTGCALWFGFVLGLALLGAQEGRGGSLLAMGMAAYGAGAVLGTLGVVRLLRVLPVLPAIGGAWALTGGCWVAMGLAPGLPVVAGGGFVSGLAVVVGNGGVTAQISRGFAGAERRTLLAGQSLVVNAASCLGLLVGGPVLARLGAPTTLVATGLVTAAVSAWVGLACGRSAQSKRPATSAARAPYPPPKRQACTSNGKSWWTPTRSAHPSASGETSS